MTAVERYIVERREKGLSDEATFAHHLYRMAEGARAKVRHDATLRAELDLAEAEVARVKGLLAAAEAEMQKAHEWDRAVLGALARTENFFPARTKTQRFGVGDVEARTQAAGIDVLDADALAKIVPSALKAAEPKLLVGEAKKLLGWDAEKGFLYVVGAGDVVPPTVATYRPATESIRAVIRVGDAKVAFDLPPLPDADWAQEAEALPARTDETWPDEPAEEDADG